MIEYVIKSEIGGVEIRLIKSQFAYVVIYGMEKIECTDPNHAHREYDACMEHALTCIECGESNDED